MEGSYSENILNVLLLRRLKISEFSYCELGVYFEDSVADDKPSFLEQFIWRFRALFPSFSNHFPLLSR